jgi:PleD family two-component response regulator
MNDKILIADDEAAIHSLLGRALPSNSYKILNARNGEEAFRLARAEDPNLILLDVNMPGKNGFEVLGALRSDQRTRGIPVIMLTGRGGLCDCVEGLKLGADDYITKPFELQELKARIDGVLKRSRWNLGANPLTRLPGSPIIQEEVDRRIRAGAAFAFLYADVDRFKAYNDAYGYAKGDEAIKATARLLVETVRAEGSPEDFVGHVGGDDFALVCDASRAVRIARKAALLFDEMAPDFYALVDRMRGCIEARGRSGGWERYPLMTLTVAGVTNERRVFNCYARVVELAAEMKCFLKNRPEQAVSASAFDRRSDVPTAL